MADIKNGSKRGQRTEKKTKCLNRIVIACKKVFTYDTYRRSTFHVFKFVE